MSVTTARTVIPLLDQQVYINGALRQDIWCASVSRNSGSSASTAQIIVPAALFDSYRGDIVDGEMRVYVRTTPGGAYTLAYTGFVSGDTGELSDSSDAIKLSANSIVHYLSKVFVGQSQGKTTVKYTLNDPYTDRPTWTPGRVLEDIFAHLPSGYAQHVALGDYSCLQTTQYNKDAADLIFRNSNYVSAIDQILSVIGGVTYVERFTSGKTYLDFFKLQDAYQGTIGATVADLAQPLTDANVGHITHNQTTQDVRTRVITVGKPRLAVITVGSDDTTVAKRLRKGWDSTATVEVLGTTYNVEDIVKTDPEIANSEIAEAIKSVLEPVYTRWLLPKCLEPYRKHKDLGIEIEDTTNTGEDAEKGKRKKTINAQAYKYPSLVSIDAQTGVATVTESTVAEKIKASFDLEHNEIKFSNARESMRVDTYSLDAEGKPVITWRAARVYVTFAYECDEAIQADTGQDHTGNINLPFAIDGLTERVIRDDCRYVQATNYSYPVTYGGESLVWGCKYYDDKTWHAHTSKSVVHDDTGKLQRLAAAVLAEKHQRHHEVTVSIPWVTPAYRIGQQLQIYGTQVAWPYPLMITSLSYDFVGNSMSITADNVKPPHRSDAR